MGDAQETTISAMFSRIRYELDDIDSKQWVDAELLGYYNKWAGTIHRLLVMDKSELNRTGTGTITTVSGTEAYELADNSMGDFWAPYRIWVYGYEPMTQCNETDRMDYEALDGTLESGMPTRFYLDAGNIGFLPAPDDEYTIRLKYWPNFVPAEIADIATDITPFMGAFDLQLEHAIMFSAKNRGRQNSSIEVSLMQLHQDLALDVVRMRRQQTYSISPAV